MAGDSNSGQGNVNNSPFSNKVKNQSSQDDDNPVKKMRDLMRRIRLVEERMESLRKKLQLIEDNMLKNNRNFKDDVKHVKDENVDLKLKIKNINDDINLIIKELKSAPKKEDVEELKKYVSLWEPINFLTENDVKNLLDWKVEEVVEKKLSQKLNGDKYASE